MENNPNNDNPLHPVNPVNPEIHQTVNTGDNDFFNPARLQLEKITNTVYAAKNQISRYVIGQHEMTELLLIGILANGHVLLEGVPGIAKTLTAKVLSKTLSANFARIQFTPDLMPSDVIGTSTYNMQTGKFNFNKGPIFSNIILIDEINRAPAKTQAALFEVMEERQITYEGTTHQLDFPFLVMATQNPVEQEGTYRLPEAQLDRFLFRIKLHYPSRSEEQEILKRYQHVIKTPDLNDIEKVFSVQHLKEVQDLIIKVHISEGILKYIADIICNTREHGKLFLGASPRASLALLRSAKTLAALRGRDFVVPDDVQFLAFHVLNHRIILTPEAEMEGVTTEQVIQEIIQKVEVPR
ncbi:MAG TPA: MoxR family ATPase [Flavobacteriales bacterium]|nr:MoxR family ATPase [Flavobacteriales bacterium]